MNQPLQVTDFVYYTTTTINAYKHHRCTLYAQYIRLQTTKRKEQAQEKRNKKHKEEKKTIA